MAAQVRSNVLESVGGLIPIFSDVEVFLSTFQGDVSILNISLELAVATLLAIERAIGFFLKNECKLHSSAHPSLAPGTFGREGGWADRPPRYKFSKAGALSFPEKITREPS